jgi:hypothetical protein
VLDAGLEGEELSVIATGTGVDNIDYLEGRHELYLAAARAATLTSRLSNRRVNSNPKLWWQRRREHATRS